ncbi:hypothetical protein [Acinetobacter terrae]|nr:hypothetical protein [Acinetobacter terrae]
MAKQQGKGSINKEYSVVTKRYQPYINMTVNQIDIDDILENRHKKPVILQDGFWIEDKKGTYLFCGYTALCIYMHLNYVGMDEVVQQLYGKKELTEEEKEDLGKIKYS